ncbi:RBM5 family protein [Megaselia abdita]
MYSNNERNRSRSISPRRRNNSRRRQNSRSDSRGRDRRRRSRSRSHSRGKYNNRYSPERNRDLYSDLISQDIQNTRRYNDERELRDDRRRGRDFERDKERERDRRKERRDYSDDQSDGYDSDIMLEHTTYHNQIPNNTIIIRGLAQHITEADISSDLIQCGLTVASIRLIRKRKTGASRGFAFVEFNSIQEAKSWMDFKQGVLLLHDQNRAVMHYSHSKEPLTSCKERTLTDWYCAKCGVFNFKRRDNCFKCYASREESEKGGEGSDEVSNILTKKIMLRNLDVLTNEEGVLTVMQDLVPEQVSKITKILICRDPLTQTSRGICYLNFDNLVDSMNTHNALKGLDPPLTIDGREVTITYCVDTENRQVLKATNAPKPQNYNSDGPSSNYNTVNSYQYTLGDVPRLAEYSASLYATNPSQHDQYLQYYSQYYTNEITNGHFDNLPTMQQLGCETANSGAAVALNAIQRQKKKLSSIETTATVIAQAAAVAAAISAEIPKGDDGKIYPAPNIALYQYDDTSGYYYDPATGLYYDAHSQYYYNNETGSYMYWNPERCTYTLAPTGKIESEVIQVENSAEIKQTDLGKNEDKKDKKENKQDKVKVAKKIVKDMEKWAKQLNQKKDMPFIAPAAPSPPIAKQEEITPTLFRPPSSGYADVGFSILEKKDKSGTLTDLLTPSAGITKLVSSYGGSDSDEHEDNFTNKQQRNEPNERDYVDFEKLTCLLCKRAFQSQDILSKHLKMSNLHKENLQKYKLTKGFLDSDSSASAIR